MINKPKVLFITNMYPNPNFSYMGIHVKEQIDCLIKDFSLNASLYFIDIKKNGKLEYLKSIFKIYKILKQDKAIDTIHIHYGLSALFLLFFRPKKKIFVTFHGADILKEQGHYIQVLISKYIAKKVNKVFILNDEMEVIMKKLRVPYEILPCGVDTDFFKDTVAQKKPDNSKLLLFSGDPERTVKNYPLFEKVIEDIKTKTNTNILVDCVHNKNREQVREILNQADCLVMTSFSEGSPQIVKEALSCNLPVVSVPVGDIPTVINGISSCYATSGHHANELADLTLLALENRSDSVREQFLNKKLYENKYICSRIYQNYINN